MGQLAEEHMDAWREATDTPMSARMALAETENFLVDLEVYMDALRGDVAREEREADAT